MSPQEYEGEATKQLAGWVGKLAGLLGTKIKRLRPDQFGARVAAKVMRNVGIGLANVGGHPAAAVFVGQQTDFFPLDDPRSLIRAVQHIKDATTKIEWRVEPDLILVESSVDVSADLREYDDLIVDFLADAVDWNQSKGRGDYTGEDAAQDEEQLKKKIREAADKAVGKLKSAIQKIPGWTSRVVVKPIPSEFLGRKRPIDEEGDVSDSFYVSLSSVQSRGDAGFSWFAHRIVDDVLDAGDPDFFHGLAGLERDYFALVGELRNPGSAKRDLDKTITLYTARPAKDRHLYDDARTIPTNIFLTTDPDEAAGYSMDLGGRDLWRVRIRMRYLILTLEHGRLRNYQTYDPSGHVPVESISLEYSA